MNLTQKRVKLIVSLITLGTGQITPATSDCTCNDEVSLTEKVSDQSRNRCK